MVESKAVPIQCGFHPKAMTFFPCLSAGIVGLSATPSRVERRVLDDP